MRGMQIILLPLLAALAGTAVILLPVTTSGTESRPIFDHFTTGFSLEGAHRLVECESCHVNAVFPGTPLNCSGCHTQGSRVRATWQPPTHMMTTDRCASCHREVVWAPVVRVDHLEVQGSCSSCHNNFTAPGQHPQHIPTTNECDACHNTRFWR